jgi:hypothetical protein
MRYKFPGRTQLPLSSLPETRRASPTAFFEDCNDDDDRSAQSKMEERGMLMEMNTRNAKNQVISSKFSLGQESAVKRRAGRALRMTSKVKRKLKLIKRS